MIFGLQLKPKGLQFQGTHMKKFLFGSVAVLALAIGPALAADVNVKTPP
jgi:hypothetical protein